MKALVYEEYAPDDNYERILKLKEIPDPKPKSNEVVFKVKAVGLNYNDIWGMRGKPIQIPMPHISGTDAAGEVIAVGEDVINIKVGDRVVHMEIFHAEFVMHVLTEENMIVETVKFGAFRQDRYGEDIAK